MTTVFPANGRARGRLRVAGVTAAVGVQRGLGALLLVVLLGLAERKAGLDGARVVGIAAALAMAAAALADFGTTPATLRDFARRAPSRDDFRRVLALKSGFGLVVGGLLAVAALAVSPTQLGAAVAVAASMLPLLGASSTGTSKLVADGAGIRLGLAAGSGFLAGLGFAAAAAAVSDNPVLMLAALPFARLVEAVVLALGLRFEDERSEAAFGLDWLWGSWPLAAYWFLSAAYLRGQVVAPAAVLSAAAGGEVAQGFSVYSAGTLLPGAIAVAVAPAITRAAKDGGGLGATLRLALVSMAAAAPVAIAMFALAVPGLRVVYGAPSGELVAYVRWGSLAMLLVAPNSLLLSLLIAHGRSRTVAALWFVVFVASTVMQLLASAAWGVSGAGVAVAAAEAVLFGMLMGAAVASTLRPAWFESRGRVSSVRAAAAAGVVGLAGGLAAPLAADRLAFPDVSSGLLVLLALPLVIVAAARAARYDIFAPAMVFAVPWTAALGVAQLPLYPALQWKSDTWWLVTLAPAALVAGALLGAGTSALRRAPAPALTAHFRVPRIAVGLFALLGLVAWVRFFLTIGSIPLLSGRIDAIRFEQFEGPTLVGTRAGFVALVFATFAMVIARRGSDRVYYGLVAVVAGTPFILTGGRLYFISACFTGLFAGVLVRGISRRTFLAVAMAGAAFVAFSAALWFARLEQQSPNPFKTYLDNYLVESRPAALRWTIPVQIAAAGSFLTLNDMVETQYYDRSESEGLYSTKALDRFVPAKDLEVAARASSPYGQVTTTYLGPWYADFGLAATTVLSLVMGVAAGLLYRAMRGRPGSVALLVLYGYVAFWLVFDIYLNFWVLHGVWLADLPLLLLLGALSARASLRQARPIGSRTAASGHVQRAGSPVS